MLIISGDAGRPPWAGVRSNGTTHPAEIGAIKRTLGGEIAGEELAEGARGRLPATHADLIRARDGAEFTPLGVSRAITISRP